jgi:MarR family transcriptional regulator, transcriptional regulator for hemolysin
MTRRAWRNGGVSTQRPFDEPTLDQLLAEPIVQQLMRRDRTDEATIRVLLQATASARPALGAKDDPDTDDPDAILWLLHETARQWRSRYDHTIRARLPGMTSAGGLVLIHLARHGRINQAALARILDIRPITLARLLDRLEARGLVTRMSDADDRRVHVLALTAKALAIIAELHELTRKTCDDLELSISQAEMNKLRALLGRMRSNLTTHGDELPHTESIRARGYA